MPTADIIATSSEFIANNLQVIHRVADDCKTYFTGLVSPEGIIHWLLQFRDPNSVQIALRLLENIHFIDDSKLRHLLLTALGQVPLEVRQSAILVPTGRAHDSASLVGYVLSKSLGYSESELNKRLMGLPELEAHLTKDDSVPAIIFFDDNITSGVQFERFLRELYPSFTGKREHVSQPWPEAALQRLEKIPICMIVAVELAEEGATAVRTTAHELGLQVSLYSGQRDFTKWLEYGGPLWASKEKALDAISLIAETSRRLFADKLEWDFDKLEKRLLGYGNLQKLTVFQHSTPKSLLPPFWKFGHVNGIDWFPLFPDRGEWEKYSARIQNAAPEIRVLARMIASGAFGKTTPSNSVVISVDGEPLQSFVAKSPGSKSIKKTVARLKTSLPSVSKVPPYGLLKLAAETAADFAAVAASSILPSLITGVIPQARTLTHEQVEQYNREVDEYVKAVDKWGRKVSRAIKKTARSFFIPLRVYNHGTRKATQTHLQLELPQGITWVPSKPSCPPPPPFPEWPQNPPAFKLPETPNERLRKLRNEFLSGVIPSISLIEEEDFHAIKMSRDKGRNLLGVHFGSILQGTYRDRTAAFFCADALAHYSISYKLYCEEVPYPVEGAFLIDVRRAALPTTEVALLLSFD